MSKSSFLWAMFAICVNFQWFGEFFCLMIGAKTQPFFKLCVMDMAHKSILQSESCLECCSGQLDEPMGRTAARHKLLCGSQTLHAATAVARWRGGAVARWRGGAVARWRGGAVARWRGGAVARWRGGAVARWRGGAVARWRGGAVARWRGGAVARWRGGAVARWRGGAVARWCGGAVVQ